MNSSLNARQLDRLQCAVSSTNGSSELRSTGRATNSLFTDYVAAIFDTFQSPQQAWLPYV
jgi:hypothetical protein